MKAKSALPPVVTETPGTDLSEVVNNLRLVMAELERRLAQRRALAAAQGGRH